MWIWSLKCCCLKLCISNALEHTTGESFTFKIDSQSCYLLDRLKRQCPHLFSSANWYINKTEVFSFLSLFPLFVLCPDKPAGVVSAETETKPSLFSDCQTQPVSFITTHDFSRISSEVCNKIIVKAALWQIELDNPITTKQKNSIQFVAVLKSFNWSSNMQQVTSPSK